MLSDREERMLLTIFEGLRDEAAAVEARWRAEPEDGYSDGPEALKDEVRFACGRALAWSEAVTTLKGVLDG